MLTNWADERSRSAAEALAILLLLAASPAASSSVEDHADDAVFECAFEGVDAPAQDGLRKFRMLAALGDLQRREKGPLPVSKVFDPTNLLEGGNLATVGISKAAGLPNNFSFVLRSDRASSRSIMMIVGPRGDPREAAAKNEYIGTLGFENETGPRWLGNCRILRGASGVAYFNQLTSREAVEK